MTMAARFDFEPMRRFRDDLRNGTGTVREGLRSAGRIYLAAMSERFDTFSKGGGDWAPLAESTLRQRANAPKTRAAREVRRKLSRGEITQDAAIKKIKSIRRRRITQTKRQRQSIAVLKQAGLRNAGSASILRDTGTLFGALQLGRPGNVFEDIQGGIRVGIGGSAFHSKGGGRSIGDIAHYHQVGGKRLPRRPILVKPNIQLRQEMEAAYGRALKPR